jgi:hypothetical protein
MAIFSRIKLTIDTGNGNIAIAADSGAIDPTWQPLLDIAFGGQQIADFNNKPARDVVGSLDNAINAMRSDRTAYTGLTPVQQGLRPTVLAFLTNWREDCREHPITVVSIDP